MKRNIVDSNFAKYVVVSLSSSMAPPRIVGESDEEEGILQKLVDAQTIAPLEYQVYERKQFKESRY
jgi:hypothetical protein